MDEYGGNHMTDLGLYTSKEFDDFHGQNDIIDIIEGCLLDNFLYYDEDEKQYIIALEHATTTWTSCLHLYIGDEAEIFEMWNNFREQNGEETIISPMNVGQLN